MADGDGSVKVMSLCRCDALRRAIRGKKTSDRGALAICDFSQWRLKSLGCPRREGTHYSSLSVMWLSVFVMSRVYQCLRWNASEHFHRNFLRILDPSFVSVWGLRDQWLKTFNWWKWWKCCQVLQQLSEGMSSHHTFGAEVRHSVHFSRRSMQDVARCGKCAEVLCLCCLRGTQPESMGEQNGSWTNHSTGCRKPIIDDLMC